MRWIDDIYFGLPFVIEAEEFPCPLIRTITGNPPDACQLLLPGKPRIRVYLEPEPVALIRRPFSTLGQLASYWRVPLEIDSGLPVSPIEMIGGFLCPISKLTNVQGKDCNFDLPNLSVLPFVYDQELEASELAAGKREEVETVRKNILQEEIWYPIELLSFGVRAIGVFRLGNGSPTNNKCGQLRFVHDERWPKSSASVELVRFGRFVGKAHF